MNRKTELQGKSIPQIVEINESKGYPTLSVNTVNGYLTHLGAFFKWCVGQGHMRQNYADGAKIKTRKTKRPDEIRKAFSKADLLVLFGSPGYREDKFKEWLPILALYTGARMNELAQLRLKDIQVVDNVPSLVFQEDPGDPTISIKNAASVRTIPLHPFVAKELNFMGYVQSMRDRGEARLFPELPYQNNNYGHKATKWFGTYKTKLGLTSKQLVFHSFRHTLTDNLKQKLITETLIDELTGHALQGETMGRYGKRYNVDVLYKEAVLKLDYGVNLEHLKQSKWCGGK
jgi:integrase